MFKKIFIAMLGITIIGAVGAAVFYQTNQSNPTDASAAVPVLQQGNPDAGRPETAGNPANVQAPQTGEPAAAAEGMIGEDWQATGTIMGFDLNGMDLTLDTGENVYVELGPTDFWQNQTPTLAEGMVVTVNGSINDEGMIHAATVQTQDGQTMTLRAESGQPMWSGGISNGQNGANGNNAQADGDHIPDPKAQADEWVTYDGTLMSFQGGNMTMATEDGELIAFQTGQPRFFASQNVTFQVGDAIQIVGFYDDNGQFMVGDITQVSTGERVMLRDPNGRPLWAGPGNGQGNGNGGK